MIRSILIVLVALAVFQNWPKIERAIKPRAAQAEARSVALYATAWCGYCKKTRELLAEKKVDYTEYDIEKSDLGREAYLAQGFSGIPILVVGDTIVRGYNREVMLAALE